MKVRRAVSYGTPHAAIVPQHGSGSHGPRCAGFTMLELTAAAGVLGMVFLVTLPLLSRVRDTREEAQRRFIALQEAANVLERLAARTSDDSIIPEMPLDIVASSEAKSVLHDVEITLTRAATADDAGLARVTVAVSWVNDAGQRTSPVSLDAWLPVEEAQP